MGGATEYEEEQVEETGKVSESENDANQQEVDDQGSIELEEEEKQDEQANTESVDEVDDIGPIEQPSETTSSEPEVGTTATSFKYQ
jgi:hypothetical protein